MATPPSPAPRGSDTPIVRLDQVSKHFSGVAAVRELSLDIRRGEFLTLLGPSGCGKTTTLRMIGGFDVPDSGSIEIDGISANGTPPHRRNVNTVFQSYALFPHLTVHDNVAYGLRMRGAPKPEIADRVAAMLKRVDLTDKAKNYPRQLSGGQMQRVALARALVNEPKVLLLDEPLSALDARLRRDMQFELRRMHRELGITFVCVTHDQEEALVMSDRIAVMHDGIIAQIGSPQEIFQRPVSRFVADFIGGCNFLPSRIGDSGELVLPNGVSWPLGDRGGAREVTIAIRPSRLRIADPATPQAMRLSARVDDIVYLGDSCRLILDFNGSATLIAECDASLVARRNLQASQSLDFHVDPADINLFEKSEMASR